MMLAKIHFVALGVFVEDAESTAQHCVLAAKGCPGKPRRGENCYGPDPPPASQLFTFAFRTIRQQQIATLAIHNTIAQNASSLPSRGSP